MNAATTDLVRYTAFDTPVLTPLLRWLSLIILKIIRWRAVGTLPMDARWVLTVAPHTSNWDLPIGAFLALALRGRPHWMGKDALFRPPFGAFFRWLGGIPVDRSKPGNVVEQMVRLFADNESFILAVAPEGTRKRVEQWKTGFYRIANGAGVPIVLGFIDYGRREGGMGPMVRPSGNLDADMERIRAFYADKSGKYANQSGRASVVDRR